MTPTEPGRLRKTLALLSSRERGTGLVVLLLLLLQAVLETTGVASVTPFLAVLGNPELMQSNAALAWAYERGRFASTDDFLFALGLAAFALVVTAAVFRIATTYIVTRWTEMRRFSLGARLLGLYLRQPYGFFLNRNSADLSKSVLSEVDQVVTGVLRPAMETMAQGLIALAVVSLLVWTDPRLALIIIVVLAAAYGLIYASVRGVLVRRGADRVAANRGRYTAASEAFGGIKDLKVLGREEAYLGRFREPARRFAEHLTISATLQGVPRHLIEAIGFGGVLAMALYLMGTGGDLGTALPVLGLYTFAGYRLLPAAQAIYRGVSSILFSSPAVDELYEDMNVRSTGARASGRTAHAAGLARELRFEHVSFRYPNTDHDTLHDLNLSIPARSSAAFVGRTGAGKTTAVDLLLGLLRPTGGRILIDGEPLTEENLRYWQNTLGYVPQAIYLADVPVRENIAFGVPAGQIDDEAVRRAARVANIHDFIETLPQGYDTEVGERGVRISGGQRQRIGIARALYHEPAVLVLDEATSALDTATERAIMESVAQLSGHKTVIMIAHRMSTVQDCDQIVMLEQGRVVGIGGFEELRRGNAVFQSLASA